MTLPSFDKISLWKKLAILFQRSHSGKPIFFPPPPKNRIPEKRKATHFSLRDRQLRYRTPSWRK
jgi:hypothetical protein